MLNQSEREDKLYKRVKDIIAAEVNHAIDINSKMQRLNTKIGYRGYTHNGITIISYNYLIKIKHKDLNLNLMINLSDSDFKLKSRLSKLIAFRSGTALVWPEAKPEAYSPTMAEADNSIGKVSI